MARRARQSLASVWGGSLQRAFQRQLNSMTRAAVRAGTRAATQATKQATQQVLKATRQAAPQPARTPAASAGGRWLTGVAAGPAGGRRYRLFVPKGAQRGVARPVLVLLHGCDQDAAAIARSTRLPALAAREGFLLLCPEQDRLANAHGCWNWFETRSGRAQAEAASIAAALAQVCAAHGGNPARVAIVGLSAGASMAALVALRHPGVAQAVVMHSGVGPGAAQSTATAIAAMQGRRAPAALPATAVAAGLPALLVIQGLADPIVDSRNGRAAAQRWAAAFGAVAQPARTVQRGQRRAATLTDFTCGRRTVVTLCEVDGLGHAWSGGLAGQPYGDARGPDASRLAWAFATKQFARSALSRPGDMTVAVG